VSVASAAKDGSGNLILTLSNGSTINAGNVVGPRGADGTSVTIVGSVATAASLPTGLTVQDAGDGYITNNDGHLHVWSGTAFTDVGVVRGPQGVKGDTGNTGVRGSNWYIGAGVPNGTNTVGSIPGDKYLDINSGDVYNLS
jgi:hypothetical protein